MVVYVPQPCSLLSLLKMVFIISTSGTIFSKHMSFWCPYLDLHLTTHHPQIDAKLMYAIELDISTLYASRLPHANLLTFHTILNIYYR